MRKIYVFQLDGSMRREAYMDMASSTFLWSIDGEQSQTQGNHQGCPGCSQKAPSLGGQRGVGEAGLEHQEEINIFPSEFLSHLRDFLLEVKR